MSRPARWAGTVLPRLKRGGFLTLVTDRPPEPPPQLQLGQRLVITALELRPEIPATLWAVALDLIHSGDGAAEQARKLADIREGMTASYPPSLDPRRFMAWARLALAAELLEGSALKLPAVAAQVGYASAATFATACRSMIDSTPTDLRREGSLRRVLVSVG